MIGRTSSKNQPDQKADVSGVLRVRRLKSNAATARNLVLKYPVHTDACHSLAFHRRTRTGKGIVKEGALAMFQPDEDGVLAEVSASSGRRLIACTVLYGLGALVLYVTFVAPPQLVLMAFMVALGGGALTLGEKMRRSATIKIIMTEDAIRTNTGLVLAPMDQIVSVDRGAFAFKPSNGFTLKLDAKQPRSWAPGLWWRLGRYVGVGGVVSAGQSKFMAEQISLRIALRDAK